ncbi:hypothetical protein D3C81_1651000 [compost metagenome]
MVFIVGLVVDLDAGFLGEGLQYLRIDVIVPVGNVDRLGMDGENRKRQQGRGKPLIHDACFHSLVLTG